MTIPGEMPESEMNVDDSGLDPDDIDVTPIMLRQCAWDIMPCAEVPDLLTALGLTHGTDEGMAIDHRASHERMAQVLPLEDYLQSFAEVMGVVVTTAMTEAAGVDLGEDSIKFAEQNAEVVLNSTRAVIAHLMAGGYLTYGSRVRFVYGAIGE